MRQSAKWMTLVDDRVLEYIDEHGHGSPKEMVEEGPIRYSRQHVARRARKLTEKGLLTHLGNGVYSITEQGRQYLRGELDTGELDANGDNGEESSTA